MAKLILVILSFFSLSAMADQTYQASKIVGIWHIDRSVNGGQIVRIEKVSEDTVTLVHCLLADWKKDGTKCNSLQELDAYYGSNYGTVVWKYNAESDQFCNNLSQNPEGFSGAQTHIFDCYHTIRVNEKDPNQYVYTTGDFTDEPAFRIQQ